MMNKKEDVLVLTKTAHGGCKGEEEEVSVISKDLKSGEGCAGLQGQQREGKRDKQKAEIKEKSEQLRTGVGCGQEWDVGKRRI